MLAGQMHTEDKSLVPAATRWPAAPLPTPLLRRLPTCPSWTGTVQWAPSLVALPGALTGECSWSPQGLCPEGSCPFSLGVDDPHQHGRGIALADFNRDGKVDIVYGNWNGPHRLYLQMSAHGKVRFRVRR